MEGQRRGGFSFQFMTQEHLEVNNNDDDDKISGDQWEMIVSMDAC